MNDQDGSGQRTAWHRLKMVRPYSFGGALSKFLTEKEQSNSQAKELDIIRHHPKLSFEPFFS